MKLSPQLRATYDTPFMQRLALVRQQVLEAKAPALAKVSPIAQMFFLESQKSVLQDLAELVAAWNTNHINVVVLQRALGNLANMELPQAHEDLGQLQTIVEDLQKNNQDSGQP